MKKDTQDSLLDLTSNSGNRQKVDRKLNESNASENFFKPDTEPPSTGTLLWTFSRLAIPNIFTNLMNKLGGTIALIYAGRLDDSTNVAVIGLAWNFIAIFLFAVCIGLNSAQETLTS